MSDPKKTPQWVFRFLQSFCPPQLFEEIEGDLIQQFARNVRRHGPRKATLLLLWNALLFFRPGILFRNKFSLSLNRGYMFRSYFKTMMRNVARQKYYSAITVSGLTVGITFAMLVGVFILGEMQVNQNLRDIDRLYLVEIKDKRMPDNLPVFVPALLSELALEKYPTVFENFYRFHDRSITVSKGDKHFRIQSMIGDSTLLSMFGFQVLYGDARTALTEPNSIVITEKIASQYFGRSDVAGETLAVSTERSALKEFRITAVISDLQKKNSVTDFMNMDAQVFLSGENRGDFSLNPIDDWSATIITYVKLSPGRSRDDATKALNYILTTHGPDAVADNKTIELNPLQNYYLTTNNGAIRKLIISLTVVVLLILILAVVNFINISIARSFSRLKEIGVRKVVGGVRKQVVVQFISESLLFGGAAGVMSLLLYQVLRNYFGDILNVTLPALWQLDRTFWAWAISGVLSIGLLAGMYPSLYLSSTRTIESLKGKFKSVSHTMNFSRGLIAVQFLIAIFVFSASLIFSRQISYFMEADLGYNRSSVLVVTSVPRLWNADGMNKMDAAKNEFLSSSQVEYASLSWGAPNFTFAPYSAKINFPGRRIEDGVSATVSSTDEDYEKVYDLDMLAGKFFFADGETHQPNQVVLNESAQEALSANLGDKIKMEFSDQEFTIVGIVKDFHFESMHQSVRPVAFIHTRDYGAFRYFSFKLKPGNVSESVEEVERLWKKVFPEDPFEYGFTDDRLAVIYKTELQLQKASVIGSLLIFLVVLTGVLGLVSLSVSRRNKEIGIRKVLGASSSNILVLISREYAMLVMIAFVAAIPLSYFFALQWLDNFAYRIDLTWWMFVAPVAFLFCTTIIVVSAQSIRAALANPVKSLRCE